jgi:hypothetical protein
MLDECESRHEVEFIEETGGYVVIRYNKLYIAIALETLKIDPFVEYLGDCFLAPRILTAGDLNVLYQRMGDSLSLRLKSSKNDEDTPSCSA